RAVCGDQQFFDELRLLLAELIELRLGGGLLARRRLDLGVGQFKVIPQLVDLLLLLGAVFAQEVDGRDATSGLQSSVDEVTVEDAHLRKLRRGEGRTGDLRRAVKLQLNFTLRERRALLD